MKLVIGLGNPGQVYLNNRHNVGYLVVDKVNKLTAKKTNVFMNDSGSAVLDILKKYPNTSLTDLYIVHDDLDIPLGQYKIQLGKGPKDHNGIKDIEAKLGSEDFWRVRVGVDNRNPENRVLGEKYVLEDFTQQERELLDKTIEEICKKLATL